MESKQNHTEEAAGGYIVRDVYPNREFTKTEQLRVATQISKLLTQTGSRPEDPGKNETAGAR